jgi:hypothetical protein
MLQLPVWPWPLQIHRNTTLESMRFFSVQVTYRDFKNAQQNLMCKWVFNYKNPPQLKIRRRAPQIYQNATLAN